MQEIIKKCYVHLERLPKHMINKCSIKVDMKYLFSSQEKLEFDEIKVEEHDDLDGDIYKDNVSLFWLWLIKKSSIRTYYKYIKLSNEYW